MGFFSSGGNKSESNSYAGLRGIGWDLAQPMGDYLLPTIQKGADTGYNMFTNPNQFLQGGLYAEQHSMIPNLVNLAGNKFSASAGARGMLSPENTGAIAGGVATNLSPFLLSLIGENIGGLRNAGGNMFLNSIGAGVSALGSEQHSRGESKGPGIGYNMANEFFKNFMEGASAPKMMSGAGSMMSGAGGMMGAV